MPRLRTGAVTVTESTIVLPRSGRLNVQQYVALDTTLAFCSASAGRKHYFALLLFFKEGDCGLMVCVGLLHKQPEQRRGAVQVAVGAGVPPLMRTETGELGAVRWIKDEAR